MTLWKVAAVLALLAVTSMAHAQMPCANIGGMIGCADGTAVTSFGNGFYAYQPPSQQQQFTTPPKPYTVPQYGPQYPVWSGGPAYWGTR